MKPYQVAQSLRRIASGIEKSKNPRKNLVAKAIKLVMAQMDQDVNPKITITLEWKEPEEGTSTFSIGDVTHQEIDELINWIKSQAGTEWGVTIPSIRITQEQSQEELSLTDFASSIRYDTGEGIYTEDNPIFEQRGIKRS